MALVNYNTAETAKIGTFINNESTEFESSDLYEKHKFNAGMNGYTKQPYTYESWSKRGIWDLTNLFQFTPYETGYCFLAILNSPAMFNSDSNSYEYYLQKAFVKMLEDEFRGLDGLEDMSVDTYEVSDGISSTSRIGKVNLPLNQTVSMKYTEKTGSLITKYLTTYLKTVKDPRTQAKCYSDGSFRKEVFNMLYVITDATCLKVEKAFLLLNTFPTSSPLGDMYNTERGDIGSKELSISFNTNVVEGREANKIAKAYIETLINVSDWNGNKINLNSSGGFAYSFHDGHGKRRKTDDITVKSNKIL